MAVRHISAEIREIAALDLRTAWDDDAQAFAKAAELAALAEASPPLIAHTLAEDGTEAPTWKWSVGPASEESIFVWDGDILMAGATPYADGRFKLAIELPPDYPAR